jgi:alkylation response protein AidB-like acyl-CoA dehydrogenase
VDLDLSADQQAIADAVASLLQRHAGAARAVELSRKAEYDGALEQALREAGFLDVATGDETGLLEAALVTEAVAKAGGCVAIGALALVAPGLLAEPPPGPVAVTSLEHRGPVRFAALARTLLVDAGPEARVVELAPGAVPPVRSNFGYPMGSVASRLGKGRSLGPGTGERLRSLWRLALAAEALGCMGAALDLTVEYVKRRRQFGRAIGSFQAVQHRLAQCAVLREGVRWLVYEAAWQGAPEQGAALAAAHACAAAGQIFAETHQLTGAMGFTREHDLHVWSMRLQALRLEAGGEAGHRRAAALARWRPEER